MTPVVYLSDAFLATGSEPWTHARRSPTCPTSAVANATEHERPFQPVLSATRETLARPWAVPGTPGLEHRIGGLEKADVTGNVSYDPDNHHRMQVLRQAKVAGIADDIPPLEVFGPASGDLLILGWGSTYGAIRSRGRAAAGRRAGPSPTPTCATSTRCPRTRRRSCARYKRCSIPEVNLGQLLLLRPARST